MYWDHEAILTEKGRWWGKINEDLVCPQDFLKVTFFYLIFPLPDWHTSIFMRETRGWADLPDIKTSNV